METWESWHDISGYEGLYQVSGLGRVRSLARVKTAPRGTGTMIVSARVLKIQTVGGGHVAVYLSKDGGTTLLLLKYLVADTFLIPPPSLSSILCFYDGDIRNCRAGNLYWQTRA